MTNAGNGPSRADACPPEEHVLGWVDGTRREDRASIEAHVAVCDRCLDRVADALGAAGRLEGATLMTPPLDLERSVAESGTARAAGPGVFARILDALFSFRVAGVVAAASLVALVVVFADRSARSPGEEPPVWRDAASPAEGIAPVPRVPVGEVTEPGDLRFVWDPVPGVRHYVVTIVDAETGTMVAREAVAETEFTLPQTRCAALRGHALEWMVECVSASGRTLESVAVPFRLPTVPESD